MRGVHHYGFITGERRVGRQLGRGIHLLELVIVHNQSARGQNVYCVTLLDYRT